MVEIFYILTIPLHKNSPQFSGGNYPVIKLVYPFETN